MAHTARSKDDKKEFFDPPDELEKKVELLAALVKKAKHFIVFTVITLYALLSYIVYWCVTG